MIGGLVGSLIYLAVVGPLVARRLPSRFVRGWVPSGWRAENHTSEGV